MESGLGGDEGMLFSQLVSGMIRGEISEEEVVDNVVLLVFAAHDTTSFAIAMTFKMLAEHPDCHSLLLQGTLFFTILSLHGKDF
jgi:cytochrome P450